MAGYCRHLHTTGGNFLVHLGLDSATYRSSRGGFVKRGARRVESTEGAGIQHAVFVNPDGSNVLVLANAGRQREIKIQVGQQTSSIVVGQNAVTTLVWV